MSNFLKRVPKRAKALRNHTVILGWSNRIYPILQELAIANANVRKPRVFILSQHTSEHMETLIRSRVRNLGKLKVITKTGELQNAENLNNARISKAKSIIVLTSDDVLGNVADFVQAATSNTDMRIVAEIERATTGEALKASSKGQVITVQAQQIIARVIAQDSRSAGLAAVVLDLLDFDGDEIYFADVPALFGKTYADALLAFNTASVIGLLNSDETALVNPTQDTVIVSGMKIIAIAEDDDKVVYTGVREDIAKSPVTPLAKRKATAGQLLIIGWSALGRQVLTELTQFLPKGSSVHISAQERYVDPRELEELKFGDISITFSPITGDAAGLNAAVGTKSYDQIIVLGYRNGISETDADALTSLTVSELHKLFQEPGNSIEPTRLVAEILDSSKSELSSVDALVVSDSLTALLIAQLSENPALAPVFEDLFDAQGASLNVRSITDYAPIGKSVSFAELVAVARNHGESAIGYRLATGTGFEGSTGVVLNPAKTSEFIPAEGDALVVVGDLN